MSKFTLQTVNNPEELRQCRRCGVQIDAADARRASFPPLHSLADIDSSLPDEPQQVPWEKLTDWNWYCPRCRSLVNLWRALAIVCALVSAVATALLLSL
jgi:hypothetical protein